MLLAARFFVANQLYKLDMPNPCSEIKQKYDDFIRLDGDFRKEAAKPKKEIDHHFLQTHLEPAIRESIAVIMGILDSPVWTRMNIDKIVNQEDYVIDPRDVIGVDERNFVFFKKRPADSGIYLACLHGILTHKDNRIHALEVPLPEDSGLITTIKILMNPNSRIERLRMNTDELITGQNLQILENFSKLEIPGGNLDELIEKSESATMLNIAFLRFF